MTINNQGFCSNCDHLTDEGYELDPLGQWGHCEWWNKEVLMDTYTCDEWTEVVLTWPGEGKG